MGNAYAKKIFKCEYKWQVRSSVKTAYRLFIFGASNSKHVISVRKQTLPRPICTI